MIRYGWHGWYPLNCLIQEEYAQRYWQDFTADALSVIQFRLAHLFDRRRTIEKPTLYSQIAHKKKKKSITDGMTGKQIIGYIASKL